MQKFLIAVILICAPYLKGISQNDVLMTIDGIPVLLRDFERLYNKNSDIPGYESVSVEEYLDMYVNFRLKVLEAERLGYDTVQPFVIELNGYREHLAESYLIDQQVIDRLVEEAYDRTIHEVNASHISIRLPNNPTPEDTLRAYQKIMDVRDRIMKGEPFEDVAEETSEDPSVVNNKGMVGWFFAFTMVFPFEDAAYKTAVGDVSMPVRTSYGYHIIKVNGKRKSPGEIKLAHIMVRTGLNDNEKTVAEAREKIYHYYDLIRQGYDFGETAREYSEDLQSADNNGQMRWIRSCELPPDLEEQVVLLHDSASYTQPMRSIYGWHIFQLLDKRPLASFEEMKDVLKEKVMNDRTRVMIAEASSINKIKEQAGFIQYSENISRLSDMLDSSVYNGQWNPVAEDLNKPVFRIGKKEYLQSDLATFISAVKNYPKSQKLQDIVDRKSREFSHIKLLEFKKQRLEDDDPAFRDLIQEYHDGILLFNISDDVIWQRAVEDSAGLMRFYEEIKSDYMWEKRAVVSTYTIHDITYADEIRKLAKKRQRKHWSVQDMIDLICENDSSDCVIITDVIVESGSDTMIDEMNWKKGTVQQTQQDSVIQLIAINDILPPEPKSFNEVRGMIIADYQDYLEKQWVAELRAKYAVIINREVLEQIHN